MSKVPIKTYSDLVAERQRLEALLIVQRQRIAEDWENVKHELEPVNSAFDVIGKMAQGDKTHPLLNLGLRFASDIFLKNFVFAKAGWVTRLAVPFVMKNYSSHLIADNGKGILGKLKGLGRLLTGRKKSHEHEPSSQEGAKFGRAGQNGEPVGF